MDEDREIVVTVRVRGEPADLELLWHILTYSTRERDVIGDAVINAVHVLLSDHVVGMHQGFDWLMEFARVDYAPNVARFRDDRPPWQELSTDSGT